MLQCRPAQEFSFGPRALKEALVSSDPTLRRLYASAFTPAERLFLAEAYNPQRTLFCTLLIHTAFDWLLSRPEAPEDFQTFHASLPPRRQSPARKHIYLQPIGTRWGGCVPWGAGPAAGGHRGASRAPLGSRSLSLAQGRVSGLRAGQGGPRWDRALRPPSSDTALEARDRGAFAAASSLPCCARGVQPQALCRGPPETAFLPARLPCVRGQETGPGRSPDLPRTPSWRWAQVGFERRLS